MEKINIVCDSINSEELFELMSTEVNNSDTCKFETEKEPENAMALDPVTLVALITMASTALAAIINGLFAVWQKKIENKGKAVSATIKIKTKDGNEFEIPQNISKNELETILVEVEKRQAKRIVLITK